MVRQYSITCTYTNWIRNVLQ